METCFGCRELVYQPCGDGYYCTYLCKLSGGLVIGDEEDDPKRCDKFESQS